MTDQLKKCRRLGCGKEYYEKDNTEGSCHYHDGKPMFHDTKKGWTCCNQIAYDWDDFQKLQPCKVGKHSDVAPEKIEFFKSDIVANAQRALDKMGGEKKIMNINEFNEAEKKKAEEKAKLEGDKPREIIKNSEGKYFCGHHGCQSKTYDPEKNEEGSCHYHLGQPMFHDRKKFWTCCKAEAYDWDDFEKLPPCAVGKHVPKYK